MDPNVREQIGRWFRQNELGRVIYTCDLYLQSVNLPSEERALWLYLKGTAHQRAGAVWFGQALSCLKEALPLTRKTPSLQAKILTTLTALYHLTTDFVASEKVSAQFHSLARRHPAEALPFLGCLLYNLGCTYEQAGKLLEARDYYAKAAKAVEASGIDRSLGDARVWLGRVMHNLGGAELKLGNLEACRAAMELADSLQPDHEYAHKKLSRWSQYCLVVGNLPEAQHYVTAALIHPLTDDMTRSDIYLTWARILRLSGRDAEAREKTMLALDHAVRAAHYPVIHESNQILKEMAV